MKFSSSIVLAGVLGVSPPTNFTPFVFLNLTLNGVGPSSGLSLEYMCHPLSMVAVKVITPLCSSVHFTALVHFTGFKICACIDRLKASMAKTAKIICLCFICNVYYVFSRCKDNHSFFFMQFYKSKKNITRCDYIKFIPTFVVKT